MKKIKFYKKPKIISKKIKIHSRQNYNFFDDEDFLNTQNLLASGCACGGCCGGKPHEMM
jgi:hypothetical protein